MGDTHPDPVADVARPPRFTEGLFCSYVVTASVAAIRHAPNTMLAPRRWTMNFQCRTGFSRARYVTIATAVAAKIVDAPAMTPALFRATERGAAERRILLWSSDPAVEAELSPTEVSGVIPVTRQPYVGLSIVNDAGNKLDYYLDRSLTWQREGCGPPKYKN